MLAMHTSVLCYYQDRHKMSDRRSLSRRGYQVLLTVWSISWSKGYSMPLLTPLIPASFGPFWSWRKSLSYSKQFIDLQSKSMYWFLYDRDPRHKIVKAWCWKMVKHFKNPTVFTIMLADLICLCACCKIIIKVVYHKLFTLFNILEPWRDARTEGYIISCKRDAWICLSKGNL